MLKNYIKIAWRNILKGKLYSAINITGLAIGLACCVFILLYVQKELSYDQFHEKKDRIFRISDLFKNSDGWSGSAWAVHPVMSTLKDNIPEIEEAAQLSVEDNNTIVGKEDQRFYEKNFAHVTPSFFEIFSFRILEGDTASLHQPYTLFLSESMARKYFPDKNPIGETLLVNNEHEYTVTGIFSDFPDNSHIKYDFLASRESQIASGDVKPNNWMGGGAFTYVLLHKNADLEAFKEKLTQVRDNYILDAYGMTKDNPRLKLIATPLTDIHLYTNFSSEQIPQGDILYVYLFSAIAFLVLLIAGINYMNLATARAASRSKEVGIRKTSGALRAQLIKQYLGESFITVFCAIILAAILVELFLPAVNNLMARSLTVTWVDPSLIAILTGLWLVVGIGAGIYPAFFLSGFKPIQALKVKAQLKSKGTFRKGLITFQLAISIALIICTIVIQRQMQFIQNKKPGYDKAQVLMIPNTAEIDDELQTLKSELTSITGVEYVSTSSFEPGEPGGKSFFEATKVEGYNSEDLVIIDRIWCGLDFTETFGLNIVAGRSFNRAYTTDLEQAILLNQTAVNNFGWDNPIGKTIDLDGEPKTVIGVVEDFHIYSLKEEVTPLLIDPTEDSSRFLAIRINSKSIRNTVSQIEAVWDTVIPTVPFQFNFLDDSFNALYRTELRLSSLLTTFALFAILIACLGLIGLSAYTAEQRTKEIGIRKVLGASVQQIMALLTKDFIKWYVLGLIIAIPIATYVMNQWLSSFRYNVSLDVWTYLIAATVCFSIVILAISWQSIRAALANPVESLRSE